MNAIQRILQTGNVHLALTLIRVWTGAMMAYHGSSKLLETGGDVFAEKILEKFGIHPVFAWGAIGAEFLGGILLAIGFLTRPAATFIAITMAVAVFNIHIQDPWSKKEFALAYLIPAIAFIIAGGGMYSIDARLSRRR